MASEIAKVISKARRFGLEDYPAEKKNAITNRVKLAKELGDLYAVLDILQREYCPDLCDVIQAMRGQKEERIKLNYGVTSVIAKAASTANRKRTALVR
jgi:hypothetical protein